MGFAVGDLVWANIYGINGVKARACVVTQISGTAIEVVYGQSNQWSGCTMFVHVRKGSLLGRRLQLSNDSYFCDMQVIPIGDVTKRLTENGLPSKCLPSTFPKFEAVAVEARRRLAQQKHVRTPQGVSQQVQGQQQQQTKATVSDDPTDD